jgi:fructoselysine-6-P-deglycase FrlB-like protein
MSLKSHVLQIPRLLQQFVETDLGQVEKLVRQWRLGEGPIFVVGEAPSDGVVVMAGYAFESLLGRAVSATPAAAFAEYTVHSMEPRSIVLAVSRLGENEEMIQAANLAKSRGTALWAITAAEQSRLAKMARAVVPVFRGEGCVNDAAWAVGAQAAVLAMAMVAARVLRRPLPEEKNLGEEFNRLPRLIEDTLPRVQDAARSLAGELTRLRKLVIAGGGFYHPVATQAAAGLRAQKIEAEGCEITGLLPSRRGDEQPPSGAVLVSGSRCRLKIHAQEAARQARLAGGEVFAITDTNDRELADRSKLAILLPMLTEPAGAILALSVLEWVRALAEPAEGWEGKKHSRNV